MGVGLAKDTEGHGRRIEDPGAHVESVTLGNALVERLERRRPGRTRRRLIVKARAGSALRNAVLMELGREGVGEGGGESAARLLQATFCKQQVAPAPSRTHPSGGVGPATVSVSHTRRCHSGAVFRAIRAKSSGCAAQ